MRTTITLPDDVHAEEMTRTALKSAANPTAFIEMASLFGELASNESFREAYRRARQSLNAEGMRSALAGLLTD